MAARSVPQASERGVFATGGVRNERQIEIGSGFDKILQREFRLKIRRRLERERLQLFLRRLLTLAPRPFDILSDGRLRFRRKSAFFLTEQTVGNAPLLEPMRRARFVDETPLQIKDFPFPKRGDGRALRAARGRVADFVGRAAGAGAEFALRVDDRRTAGERVVGSVALAVRNVEVAGRRERVSVRTRQEFRFDREENLLQKRRVRRVQTLDANDALKFRDSLLLRFERRRENRRDGAAEFALHRERSLGRRERRRRNERDRFFELRRSRRERTLGQVEAAKKRIVGGDLRQRRDFGETETAVEDERVRARRRNRESVFRREKVSFAVESNADDQREIGRNVAVGTNDERVEAVLAEQLDENERAVERRSAARQERLPRTLGDRARRAVDRARRDHVGDRPVEQTANDRQIVLVFPFSPIENVAEPNAFLQEVGVLGREGNGVEIQNARKFAEPRRERFEVVKGRMLKLANLRLKGFGRVGELELFRGSQLAAQFFGEGGETAQGVGVEFFRQRFRSRRGLFDDRLEFVRVFLGRRAVFVEEERDQPGAVAGDVGEFRRFLGERVEFRVRFEVGRRGRRGEPIVERAERAAQIIRIRVIFLFFGRLNDLREQFNVLLLTFLLRRALMNAVSRRGFGLATDVGRRRATKERRRRQRRKKSRRRGEKRAEISHRKNLESGDWEGWENKTE